MATRKTTKKVATTKKTSTKKAPAKRAYTRKVKDPRPVAEGKVESVDEQIQKSEIENLRYRLQNAHKNYAEMLEENVSLYNQLRNPADFGLKLRALGDEIYIDLAHLKDNVIGKALIAHVLGKSGYVSHASFEENTRADTVRNIQDIVGAQVLKLNTINRVYCLVGENSLQQGTPLHRITMEEVSPSFNIQSAVRHAENVIVQNGVTYRRTNAG